MKILKKALWFATCILTVYGLVFGSLDDIAFAVADTQTVDGGVFGADGDNLSWELNDQGVLTVAGTGAMADLYTSDYPWYAYAQDVTEVRIEQGVTNIGTYMCEEYDSLQRVLIADTVCVIGNYSFNYCDRLESVSIPDSVESIGLQAFYRCPLLSFVHIEDTDAWFTTVFADEKANPLHNGADLLKNGSIVTEITVPDTVTEIADFAFYGCTSLEKITLHDAVEKIGNAAFYACTSLRDVEMPPALHGIGEQAFYGCEKMTVFAVPENMTSLPYAALQNCTALRCLLLPAGFERVEAYATDACDSLLHIYYYGTRETAAALVVEDGNDAFNGSEMHFVSDESMLLDGFCLYDGSGTQLLVYGGNERIFYVPETVTAIDEHAFDGVHDLKLLVLPANVQPVGEIPAVFSDGIIAQDGAIYNADKTELIFCDIDNTQTAFTVSESVTSIAENAFADCSNLQEIILHDGIADIGIAAFAGCKNLQQIKLSAAVCVLSDSLFKGCSLLAEVSFPEQLTGVGVSVFADCKSLAGLTLPETITAIGDYAFANCRKLTEITVPQQVTTLSDGIFAQCSLLQQVSFSEQLSAVGAYAFAECISLSTLQLPETVQTVGDYAFYGCTGLTQFDMPAAVTKLSNGVFYQCYQLRELRVSDALQEIGEYALYDCVSLHPFTIPASVARIGRAAFFGCEAFSQLVLPENLTVLKQDALHACILLAKITLPEGLQTIEAHAFKYCQSLASVYIPASVTNIAANAFENCNDLKNIYFGGNEEQWNAAFPDGAVAGVQVIFEHTHTAGKWYVTVYPQPDSDGLAVNNCVGCNAESQTVLAKNPFVSNRNATVDIDGRVSARDELTVAELLQQAGEGAFVSDANGEAVAEEAFVGTGMKLMLADGSQMDILVIGDFDGDGIIDSSDARTVLRLSVGLEDIAQGSVQYRACDVDDGIGVSASDARAVLRASVSLDDPMQWKR